MRRTTRHGARAMAAAATAVLAAASLAACGSAGSEDAGSGTSGGEDGSGSAGGVDDGTQLTMWTRAPLEKQAKNAVEAYNSSHQNQVKLEVLPNDDVEGKVGAAVQSDSLPDILAGDVVRIPYWVQQGIFTDITDRIDALPNKADLQSGHIDAGTSDGAEYTLPFVTDISVMVWNKDLYTEAGLDPEQGPTTLQEFVDQAKAVAALGKDGVSGTYLAGQSGGALVFTLFPMIWASGEEALSEDGTQSLVDNDAAQDVYAAYRELVATPNGMGAGSKEETGATWTAPFQDGKVGVMPYPYTSVSGLFDTADFGIGVAPIPGVDGGQSTFLGGDALGISKSSQNVDQAWSFLAWLMSEDAQQTVFADNNDTASNLTVLADGYADADPRTVIANGTIKDGRTPVAAFFNEAFNAAGSPWQLLIQDAVWGDGSQMESLNDQITSVLGQ
ncbi:MAG: sugar ABC transporter substrate-binding protein [Actinomyces sp.]|nr:sugar ABC transporter substrate-binding protein [Actinomyces sp.]MCI1642890.1 sugar ABC transporter substrate-binding protein [Actinomyces sp.]MCI1663310.1 sugar ABC transporter substrate-binding protein [Actinomyces sp.]MCI1692192.1 sugar ABC transporter substrate-binding protein [Actinomyces sp.]MCI1788748.1 sugar ABC transporter substrate-binding protein [Actinomyces sp.]MCI1831151.1 sugar ABC transporter substrate-binding protein [Actinomyces sp.]